jgi:Kef-type K+ transport system membrane component KefB
MRKYSLERNEGGIMLTGQILLQLIIILIVVQLFGYLCRRIGQQWVIGEILAGLALGPSLLGALLPGVRGFLFPASTLPMLQVLGDIGLVLYMFALGARLDTHLMLHQSKKAMITSISGILLPLVLGAMLAFFLFPSLGGSKATLVSFMLLVGVAMAITAFPVLARLLTEKNMLATKIGTLALTCAAVDDVTAWCLLALVIAMIHAQSLLSVGVTIGFTLLFAICMLTVVRPLLDYVDRHIHSKQVVVVFSIALLLLSAYATNGIGIHPVFGAFLMGIILPRKTLFVKLVRNIDQVNTVLFLPLFFVYSGLRTQIGLISSPWMWLICLLVLVIACIGKISGGAFAARFMGESWRDSFGLGILMNTRGLVELIVLNIGLDLGVLSPTLFAILVIMALMTTMMASPLLPLLGYKQQASQKTTDQIQDTNAVEDSAYVS